MGTELLFRVDAYLKTATARVVAVHERGAGRVRLLRIPGIDLQPCGGTHVGNIAEIGGIRVLRVRSEGRRNKRVEIALAA
jgi:Ser-tRNA(Ala) deacylase AlaX